MYARMSLYLKYCKWLYYVCRGLAHNIYSCICGCPHSQIANRASTRCQVSVWMRCQARRKTSEHSLTSNKLVRWAGPIHQRHHNTSNKPSWAFARIRKKRLRARTRRHWNCCYHEGTPERTAVNERRLAVVDATNHTFHDQRKKHAVGNHRCLAHILRYAPGGCICANIVRNLRPLGILFEHNSTSKHHTIGTRLFV